MDQSLKRHLQIAGRVQGVGFRSALRAEALRLGLTGWVRNRNDGTVEALVAGETAAVEALTRWARHGPPAARVDDVRHADLSDESAIDPGGGFQERPTC